MNENYLDKVYKDSFVREIEKIAFGMPWKKKKKRKRKKKEKNFSFTMPYMPSMESANSTVNRIGIGFGRFLSKRGF